MLFPVVAKVALLLLGAAWQGQAVNHWTPRDEPSCYVFNETCGPITPVVPKQYAATLEVVDREHNVTRYAEEIYDEYNQLLAIYETFDSHVSHTIFFYKLDTVVIMTTFTSVEDGVAPVNCKTASISKDRDWFTAFPGNNGTHYAIAPSKALLFGNEFRYSYINNTGTEREQPCNRWDACIPVGSDTIYVKYYWTDPNEVMEVDFYAKERPLTMRLTGTISLPKESSNLTHLDEQYSFASFIDYPDMEDYRWAFEIPSGMYCPGLPAGKDPPTNLPKAYSARTELIMKSSILPDEKYVTTLNIWYDYPNQIDRQDGIPVDFSQEMEMVGPVEVTIIRDFRSMVEYVIDKTLGNCTTLPISFSYDTIVLPDGSIAMADPIKMLTDLDKIANLTYHGEKQVRGMPCEAWVGHAEVDLGNGTLYDGVLFEYCFLQEGWQDDAGPTDTSDYSVPLFVRVQQDLTLPQHPMFNSSFLVWEHMFKYEAMTPLMSTYDITLCFSGHDHIRRFQMAFPGQFRGDFDTDPKSFLRQVEYGIVPYLKTTIIRLQQGLIEYDENTDRLMFEFTLVDRPQVDFELPDSVGPPLQEVVDNLVQSMDQGLLIILWNQNYETQWHMKKMYAINDSLQEMFEDSCVPPSRLVPQHHPEPEPEKYRVDTSSENRAKEVLEDAALSWSLLQEKERFIPETFLDSLRQYTRAGDVTYTPGDMAGMGVGMALLGILLGWIIMMVIIRKLGMSNDIEFIPMSSRRK